MIIVVFFLVVGQVNFYIDPEQTQTQANGKNKAFTSSSTKFFNDEKRESEKENAKKRDLAKGTSKMLFKIMTNGSYFGEVDIIFRRKRVYDLITASDCDMYILSRTVGRIYYRNSRTS